MPRDHKSFPRVYVEADLAAGTPVTLDADQSNHLVNVLRLKQGDAAILFNGRDGAWLGKITKAGKKGATVDVVVQTAHQTPASDLWFGFAPLKTGRLDYVVQWQAEYDKGWAHTVAHLQPAVKTFPENPLGPDELLPQPRQTWPH